MGVAEQMLLNQVTIFNPSSSSVKSSEPYYKKSSSSYRSPSIEDLKKENARAELRHLFGDDVSDSRYSFGWSNPREIYK